MRWLHVRYLNLDSAGITAIPPAFGGVTSLRSLSIQNTSVAADVSVFGTLTALTYVAVAAVVRQATTLLPSAPCDVAVLRCTCVIPGFRERHVDFVCSTRSLHLEESSTARWFGAFPTQLQALQ